MAGLPPGFTLDAPGGPPSGVAPGPVALPQGFAIDTPDILQGMTDTAAKYATLGLADPVTAAGRAAVQGLFGADGTFGERYQHNLAQERGQEANFAAAHPVLNAVAAVPGAMTPAAPLVGIDALRAAAPIGAATRPFFANPGTAADAGASLLRQMGTGATTGGVIGGVSGGSDTQRTDPIGVLRDIGAGAAAGAGIGGVLPVGGALLAKPLSALTRAMFPGSVDRQAAALLAGRMGQDVSAGGPGAPQMSQALANAGPAPLSLADVGGENVRSLAGNLSRSQGEPREIASQFLGDRLSGMGPRLIDSLDTNLSNGNAFQAAQDLITARQATSRPLYEAALNKGAIDDPAVNGLIQNSSILRNAINSAKASYPAFQGLPNNDMRLLDQAYKAIGGKAEAARRAGDGALAYNLDGLRTQFKDAVVGANPEYGQALEAFSGPSDSLRAMEMGQNFRSMTPQLIEQTLGKLAPGDADFFRLGAADTMRTAVGKTGTPTPLIGANAVNDRGADYLKQQLRPLFPSQDAYDRFVQHAGNENLIFSNTNKLIGNSLTAGRMAEDHAGGHGAGGALANLAAGSAALLTEPWASLPMIGRGLAMLRGAGENTNPAVRAQAARMVFSADPAQNAQTLAQMMARGPNVVPAISNPLAMTAGSLYPRYELLPGEKGRQ